MLELRKIHCVEELNGTLDNYSLEEVRELCGFYEPNDDDTWEVTLAFEGSFYTAQNQFEAHMIANSEQMLAMQLLRRNK